MTLTLFSHSIFAFLFCILVFGITGYGIYIHTKPGRQLYNKLVHDDKLGAIGNGTIERCIPKDCITEGCVKAAVQNIIWYDENFPEKRGTYRWVDNGHDFVEVHLEHISTGQIKPCYLTWGVRSTNGFLKNNSAAIIGIDDFLDIASPKSEDQKPNKLYQEKPSKRYQDNNIHYKTSLAPLRDDQIEVLKSTAESGFLVKAESGTCVPNGGTPSVKDYKDCAKAGNNQCGNDSFANCSMEYGRHPTSLTLPWLAGFNRKLGFLKRNETPGTFAELFHNKSEWLYDNVFNPETHTLARRWEELGEKWSDTELIFKTISSRTSSEPETCNSMVEYINEEWVSKTKLSTGIKLVPDDTCSQIEEWTPKIQGAFMKQIRETIRENITRIGKERWMNVKGNNPRSSVMKLAKLPEIRPGFFELPRWARALTTSE